MGKWTPSSSSLCCCDYRYLLVVVALTFFYMQMRLFATQSEYAYRIAAAVEAENHCTSQTRLLIYQISVQQGQIVALQEEKKRLDEKCRQLRALVKDLERKGLRKMIGEVQVPVAAVVVMACNRADYLERTIKSILKYQKSVASKYPLFVSQDGSNLDVRRKAMSYDQLTYMQHLDYEPVHTEHPGEIIAYYKIARHYKWALDQLFNEHNFSRVIILEDDMEIAPDFFDYFEAGAALLDSDKSILAISSWNDNGQKQFVHDPYALYRSDFFPGLGWMLSKSTWNELSPKWPKAYWDDWLRLKENHRGRQFIRPEVCRTYNFGEHVCISDQFQGYTSSTTPQQTCSNKFAHTNKDNLPYFFYSQTKVWESTHLGCYLVLNKEGSSLGQFFQKYLEPIKLNDVQVDWKSMNLSYLMEDKYVKQFADMVKNARPVSGIDAVLKAYNIDGDVRIQYRDQAEFEHVAAQFGIFEEWKDGIPRAAYKGVVVFRYQTPRRVFLVGPNSLQQLGIEHA